MHLESENDNVYKNIKKLESQNGVILDSLKDEINAASQDINHVITEVPSNEREIINREIEEEFSNLLSGYNVNKAKYAHLRNIDPKELSDVANVIKQQLDTNDKFYLHGDYNFYNQ